jgi:hypothetical protein
MKHENPVKVIRVKRIKAGSLFKFILIPTSAFMIPFFILCGVAAFFGAQTVKINEQYVTGAWGLIAALIMAPLFALLSSAFTWVFAYLAIRIIGRFRPFTLSYVSAEEN